MNFVDKIKKSLKRVSSYFVYLIVVIVLLLLLFFGNNYYQKLKYKNKPRIKQPDEMSPAELEKALMERAGRGYEFQQLLN